MCNKCILVDPPYLLINNIHDIKKVEGHMSLTLLLKGTNTPIKRKIEEKPIIQVRLPKKLLLKKNFFLNINKKI